MSLKLPINLKVMRYKNRFTEYKKSTRWKKLCDKMFSIHPSECMKCGSKYKLEVKFKTGCSPFTKHIKNLIILCEHCETRNAITKQRRSNPDTVTFYPNRSKPADPV